VGSPAPPLMPKAGCTVWAGLLAAGRAQTRA
jgi:hypothetical protein